MSCSLSDRDRVLPLPWPATFSALVVWPRAASTKPSPGFTVQYEAVSLGWWQLSSADVGPLILRLLLVLVLDGSHVGKVCACVYKISAT